MSAGLRFLSRFWPGLRFLRNDMREFRFKDLGILVRLKTVFPRVLDNLNAFFFRLRRSFGCKMNHDVVCFSCGLIVFV